MLNSNVNTCLTPFVVQESHKFKGKSCEFSYNSTTFLFFLAAFGCFWKTKTYLTRGRHWKFVYSFPKDSTKTESPSRLSASSADGPALAKLGLALTKRDAPPGTSNYFMYQKSREGKLKALTTAVTSRKLKLRRNTHLRWGETNYHPEVPR